MDEPTPSATQELGWSSLPADLLRTIVDLLPWSSQTSFAATCRHWRTAVSPFYPAWVTPVLLNAADVGTTNIRYYSPYYHKNFEVSGTLIRTPNAKLCCVNGHRLTVCHYTDNDELIVVNANLVTGKICNLYPLDRISFDFVAYDGARRIFGINVIGALDITRAIKNHDGGWDWEFSEFNPNWLKLDVSPATNPVFHRGLLYLLSVDGELAVYDDRRFEEGFEVLDKPRGFGFECDNYYLFESDEGELMVVLFGHRGFPVHIVKLNEQNMEWEKVESLEGRALFTGTLTISMVKTGIKWMQNKIFIPRLYDWPEIISVDLVEREGELAFVPISSKVPQHSRACGTSIWACGLGSEEAPEFWETVKIDHSIWVDFSK